MDNPETRTTLGTQDTTIAEKCSPGFKNILSVRQLLVANYFLTMLSRYEKHIPFVIPKTIIKIDAHF